MSVGATFLYIFANFFLKDIIKRKFSKRFIYLNEKFKKNEFNFFLIYRFVGGIPFFIAKILPVIFNVNLKNYFFGTFFGMLPMLFIGCTLGSGLEKVIIENSTTPTILDIITAKDVYYPIFGFILVLILGIIIKRKLY